MNTARFGAAAAALLVLSACEKPATPQAVSNSPMTASDAAAAGAGQMSASALPSLPVVPEPVFGPDFTDIVGSANLFVIAEAKLAQAHSANAEVKAFAADMLDAHTKANAALQTAVDASGQTIYLPGTMPDAWQVKATVLGQTTGKAFDTIYLADQIAAHDSEITALTTYARRGDVAAFKKFAAAALETEKAHLARTTELQAKVK